MDFLGRVLSDMAFQLLCVGGLLVFCATLLYQLNHVIGGFLAQTFGWKSVLWTGWIGTPVHEISHAVMCPPFKHRIDKVVLFEPDPKSGVLGYVRHSYDTRSIWAQLGNVFIGMAPLFGGALALYLVMLLLLPDVSWTRVSTAPANNLLEQGVRTFEGSAQMLWATFSGSNLLDWRFYLFLYLVLSIGCHLAPSRADFEGSMMGFWLVLMLLFWINVAAQAFGGIGEDSVFVAAGLAMPVVALLMLAILLNLASLVLVLVLIVVVRKLRGESWRIFPKLLALQWKRLTVVMVMSAGFFSLAAWA